MANTYNILSELSINEIKGALQKFPANIIQETLERIVADDKKSILEKFIKAGINPNIRLIHKHNISLLHVSALHKAYQCAEYLIKLKVDIDAYDNDFETPLINACWEKDVKMASILLAKDADPFVHSVDGYTI